MKKICAHKKYTQLITNDNIQRDNLNKSNLKLNEILHHVTIFFSIILNFSIHFDFYFFLF